MGQLLSELGFPSEVTKAAMKKLFINPSIRRTTVFIHKHAAGGYRDPKLEELHRENILFLYSTILDDWLLRKIGLFRGFTQTETHLLKVEKDLQRWTTAVQNYEYFKKTTSPLGEVLVMGDSGGPTWKSTYEFAMRLREARSLLDGQDRIARQHEIITEWRQSLGKSLWDEKLRNRLPTDELHQFALRLLVATLGGLSLVVPMLVMSIHPSQTKSLVTTSAFVIFFGIGMATFVPQAEYKDLLGSTAAYAAVLVVFVGVGAGT